MEPKHRVMPHNVDAEKCVIASIIIDSELGKDIIPEVKSYDFYLHSHKTIFEKISELYYEGKEIDIVTLSDKLEQSESYEKIGGIEYLSEIASFVPSAANYKYYLEIVKRDSLRRRLIRESQSIVEKSFEMENATDLLKEAEKNIFDLAITDRRSFPTKVAETISEVLKNFDEYAKNKGKLKGITTGFRELDNFLNGLNRSDLVLVAGRPGTGKTSFAMNLVENAALAGYSCAVFSLEMPKVQISQRMLCSNAEVSMERAQKGKLSKQEWEKLLKSQQNLSKVKIFVDDSPAITPADIQSKARRLKSQNGLDLIMIDYIQLMSSGGRKTENRQLEIAEISRSLKLIAREIDIPVIALSQLSRQIENRDPPLPQLSDLRDSGAIEQDADVIMFIYNPASKSETSDAIIGGGNGNDREIIIAKHRNGSIGKVNLGWVGEYTKFVNVNKIGNQKYNPPKKQEQKKDIQSEVKEKVDFMEEIIPPIDDYYYDESIGVEPRVEDIPPLDFDDELKF